MRSRYANRNSIDTQQPDQARDKVEWVLARRAITERVPMMGICRGHQMLTIAHGGSLHQDMYTCLGLDHPSGKGVKHNVKLFGPLADKVPTKTVNSLHHQAVNTIPLGFDIAATSKDGVIEAIYRPGALGVQWHPELMLASNKRWATLFDWWLDGLD